MARTLIVSFFGGPSSGKSTTATGVFSRLKQLGINSEYVSEFAKDLVWQQCRHMMTNQIWIFGVQHERLTRHLGQVDVVVTDAPLLHSAFYNTTSRPLSELVWEEHSKLWNLNIFLERAKKFEQAGRVHDEKQSKAIDRGVLHLLQMGGEPYVSLPGTPETIDLAVAEVLKTLEAGE